MPILLQTDKNTILIFLQNGIGHLSQIEKLPHKHILVGVVEHGAMKEGMIESFVILEMALPVFPYIKEQKKDVRTVRENCQPKNSLL